MLRGQNAINYLVSKVNEEDPSESSHWKKFHSNFKVKNEIVDGIEGFGSTANSYSWKTKPIHYIFQLKYRLLSLSSFKMFSNFLYFDFLNTGILRKMNKAYSIDALRQTLTLAFLSTKIPSVFKKNSTFCIIGDGFGNLTSLLYKMRSNHNRNIINVNLTKTLLVDLLSIKKLLNKKDFQNNVVLINENSTDNEINEYISNNINQIFLIEAKNCSFLKYFDFDLILNIASMQEMNNEDIQKYFDIIHDQKQLYFYCCNREEKILPDGTITRINNYPWNTSTDKIIINELCPWHQSWYSFRPPYYRNYDGSVIHQLRLMNLNNN
jgi:hypothetical protein